MRLAAAVIAAVVIAGCGTLQPDWVVNRLPLPSCGEEVLEQGEAADAEVRTCLLDAYLAGRGAEMISTQPTIEGDPITRYIRVHENGVVEIFVDATRDQYGSESWERLRCEALLPVEDANVFVENGCEQLPLP
jgi:hypothetical protein